LSARSARISAAEHHHLDSGRDARAHRGLVPERGNVGARVEQSAAEILDHRDREAASERHEIVERRAFGEARDREVRRVHAQDRRGAIRDRGGIVRDARAIGGADFSQHRAGLRHDVGDAEAAADLDQLATRDDHLAAGGERRERHQRRSGVVVDDHRGIRAGQLTEQPLGMDIAPAARALGDVVFEIGVTGGQARDARGRRTGEWGASKIGMNDDAGGVDDRHERRRAVRLEPRGDGLLERRRDVRYAVVSRVTDA
jgi:hypothetical protein